jgi:hypothetical protein
MLDRLIFTQSNSTVNVLPLSQDADRRQTLRVELPFPAVVRGIDPNGERFTLQTTLDNLSACGLYLRLARRVEPGESLFLVVRLSAAIDQAPAPTIAVRGMVLRIEPQSDGCYGVALKFDQHRFLYPRGTAVE